MNRFTAVLALGASLANVHRSEAQCPGGWQKGVDPDGSLAAKDLHWGWVRYTKDKDECIASVKTKCASQYPDMGTANGAIHADDDACFCVWNMDGTYSKEEHDDTCYFDATTTTTTTKAPHSCWHPGDPSAALPGEQLQWGWVSYTSDRDDCIATVKADCASQYPEMGSANGAMMTHDNDDACFCVWNTDGTYTREAHDEICYFDDIVITSLVATKVTTTPLQCADGWHAGTPSSGGYSNVHWGFVSYSTSKDDCITTVKDKCEAMYDGDNNGAMYDDSDGACFCVWNARPDIYDERSGLETCLFPSSRQASQMATFFGGDLIVPGAMASDVAISLMLTLIFSISAIALALRYNQRHAESQNMNEPFLNTSPDENNA